MTTTPHASCPHATMRQALAVPGGGIHLNECPVPVPAEDQLLVASTLVGICGSDTHAVAGSHPFLVGGYVPGHEAVGVVVAAGAGQGERSSGTPLTVGQRVLLKPNVTCGECQNCLSDRSNACENLSWIGCDPSRFWSGAMADYFVAPRTNLFAVPDGVDDPTAALVECLATPVHAARIAGDLTGARVAVIGAGTIGVLSAVAARRAGAAAVVMTDNDPGKVARALRIGADAAVSATAPDVDTRMPAALGGPADVVLDCVASERSLAQAVRLLRRAGTLLVVGVPAGPASLPMPEVQDWELRIQGCAAYTETDMDTAISIAVDGGIPTDELIAGTYPLDQVATAFSAAATDSAGKVLISLP